MRFFYDTEFVQRAYPSPLLLITIGIVAEDGREYFACNRDFDPEQGDEWVRKHVVPRLPAGSDPVWKPPGVIATELRSFLAPGSPELWGYCSAYDHVLLVQLLGGFAAWPDGWPYYTRELRQWQDVLGVASLPLPWPNEHDALADARWCRAAWQWLSDQEGSRA